MKAKMLTIAIIVAILSTTTVSAQKVVTDGNQIIIEALGISSTPIKKARTTKADYLIDCVEDLTDIASVISNEKVYYRFEVSKEDNNVGTGFQENKWRKVIDLCAGLTYNGSTNWRAPTQRELMLMWVLKPELERQIGFTSFRADTYWSGTAVGNTSGGCVSFADGQVYGHFKTQDCRVRCIRDL